MNFTKINKTDLSFLNEVRNEYSVEFLHDSRRFTIEETIVWYKTINPDYWVIWENDERVGYFRITNYSEANHNLYIGADIHKKYLGKGLGYLSYKLFIPYVFDEYKLHKVSLEVLQTNIRAINLYKKLGFTIEGVKRDEINKNGIWVDSIIMSQLKSEINEGL
jgi:RimJ/RimL family protein N-acetyltransferase